VREIETQLRKSDPIELDREKIHVSGLIQPHGVVIVLKEPELEILQISDNASHFFANNAEDLLGQKLAALFDTFQIEKIEPALRAENLDFVNPSKLWARTVGDEYAIFDGIFHRNSEGFLILELEPATSEENIPFLSFYHLAKVSINQLQETANRQEFCQIIVREVRKITGFDRVMLYKFDEDNHGVVIAEEKAPEMEAYLGLHYPASDIPKPARKLFISNYIRIIPDSRAMPAELIPATNPITNTQLDLTNSTLRSASGCHLEYLQNMGVGASLTISLIKDGQLWGLIACHHRSPKYVSYELRKACELLGKVIFSEISSREETKDYDYKMKLTSIRSQLVDYMSEAENFVDGLVKEELNLLDLTGAEGAVICFNGDWTVIGKTPTGEELTLLIEWLQKNNDKGEIFVTDSLANIYPDASQFKNVGSGLLAIPISKRNYVLWFRPEVIQTVNWGGNPSKAFASERVAGILKLSPRKSFEKWKEIVKLTSLPWKQVEINAALELRKAIVNIILKQADELAQLAGDLERSNAELKKFAYVASHDLQEPLNQVANYVQLLEMRYQDRLDGDAKEFIDFAVEGVSLMQTLIDDVLAYSKVDLQGIECQLIDLEIPFNKALANLRGRIKQTEATITRDPLPTVMGDRTQLMQLFQNLIGNAIKFRSQVTPKIHIGAKRIEDAWLFSVQDNGIGIDPRFSDRIFIIFQRLHPRDEYPGTGMGLAICKKIVECHRGKIWVESKLGRGATFYFTIPLSDRRNGRKG